MKKRVVVVILAIILVFSLLPVSALADAGAKSVHSHQWKGNFAYDDRVVVKTADANMGLVNHSESDSKFSSGDTWHFKAEEKPGYRFVGWTFNNAYLVDVQSDASNANLTISYKYNDGIGWDIMWGTKFTATANFEFVNYYTLTTSVTGDGTIVKSPDSESYGENTDVSLTAEPKPGWRFVEWSGDASGTNKSVTITMNGNKSVSAKFEALPIYILNVTTIGEGTVSKNPDDPSLYWQDNGVTLTANAAGGWRFGSWSGSASGVSNPVTLSMDGNKDVTATFIKTYNITLNVVGPGHFDDINTVAGTRDENSVINLNDAGPDPNYGTCKFIGWRDDVTNDYVDSTFTLTGDRSFTAVFGDREYLHTSSGNHGYLMNDLDGHRSRYEQVNLSDAKPTPDPGYTLDCWKEYGYLWSGSGRVVTLTDDKPIVTIGDSNWFRAHFKVADYKINYDLNGGTVNSNPSTYTYFDSAFTLNNPTRTGYIFAGWTGTGLSSPSTSVTIPKNSSGERTYTANWTPITYSVAYDANGGTGAMASSSYTYDVEQALAANAFTKQGCDFAGWATSADGSVVYSDKKPVKNLTETNGATVTLYAKWQVGGISVNGFDGVYDAAAHSVTVSGDVSGATVTYSTDGTTYTTEKPAYTNITSGEKVYVKVERLGAAPFMGSATVKIAKAALTVSAKHEYITYGDAAPASFIATYSGFVGGEDEGVLSGAPVLGCSTYSVGQNVGDYAISVTAGTLAADNYEIKCVDGTLTVAQKTLTVKARNKQTTYGQDAPAFTVRYTGFISGDDETKLGGELKFTCSYVAGDPVRPYEITASGLTSSNYYIEYKKGTLTVNPAALTVTAKDASVTYGEDTPAFEVSYSGFISGDDETMLSGTPAYDCAYAAGSPVQGYAITPSGLFSTNYTLTFAAGTLTVNKAALTVTAQDETVTFNDAPPAYSVNYSGFIAGDDETKLGGLLTFTCGYNKGSAVGTYSITPDGLTSQNYDMTYNAGTLTVDELILTVTFKGYDGTVLDTQQIVYGDAAKAPSAPAREGYDFTGWDKNFDAVTDNMTVTAQYAIKTYTVSFFEQDGVTPVGLPQTVNWGSAAVFETAPAVAGHAFDQWVLTGSDASVTDSLANVKEDIKAVASYIRNGYTVTFVDYQGRVIGTDGVLYGESATAPVVPAREGHTFIGWDTLFNNVVGNLTVTAQYTINTYTVRFVDFNGDELSVQTVNWNTAATAPANPTRAEFTFAGWDTVFNAVADDLVVTAQYRRNAVVNTTGNVDDADALDGGDTQNGGTQNQTGNQAQNDPQTLTDEPVPGTAGDNAADDSKATLNEEAVPLAQPSVFPWWWILIGIVVAGGIFWFVAYKRRKNKEKANEAY